MHNAFAFFDNRNHQVHIEEGFNTVSEETMIFFCCIPDIGETISVIEGILPVGMYVLQGCSLCGCVLAVNREFIVFSSRNRDMDKILTGRIGNTCFQTVIKHIAENHA